MTKLLGLIGTFSTK